MLDYGHLVLATGARNRLLDIPNANLADVRYLRILDESEALRQRIASARHVVVIGAGFIGLEFAATARAKGLEVDVVELGTRVMARAVTAEISDYFQERHTAAGIRIHLGVQATSIESDGTNVTGVSLSDGRHMPADLVVVGVGVLPNVELAAEAGLPVAAGIIVDEQLLTSDPNISAIGDCALFASPRFGGSLRLESVQNATDHARCVAARLTGDAKPYDGQPWFWSDQGDDKLQIAGLTTGYDRVVVRGDRAQRVVLGLLLQGRPAGRHRVRQSRRGPRVRTQDSWPEQVDHAGTGGRSQFRSEGCAGLRRLFGECRMQRARSGTLADAIRSYRATVLHPGVRRDDEGPPQLPPPSASMARRPSAARRSTPRHWRKQARRESVVPPASCAATAPTKQSPAPVVSTALTVRPAMISGLPSIERKHAALAQRHADDFVLAGLQRSRCLDEAGIIVAVAKFGLRQQAELGFIEDQDIDEIEQLARRIRSPAPD